MRKLSDAQVAEIRALLAANPTLKKNAVAKAYGVGGTVISDITLGHTHRDVDQDVRDALAKLKGTAPAPKAVPVTLGQRQAPQTSLQADSEVSRLTREVYILRLEMGQLQAVVEQLRGAK